MLDAILEYELKPKVDLIDRNGIYPESVIRNFGKTDLYDLTNTNSDNTLLNAIKNMASVSNICATTGFCVWCQDALVWYLMHTKNTALKDSLLEKTIRGEILGGTGLSNPLKAYAKIEKNHLRAKRVSGGYTINGTLPWVSNIEYGHVFGAIFNVTDKDHNVMGIIRCDSGKVLLKLNHKFCALDGSATRSVVLKDYFIPDFDILADPVEPYLVDITPGFILLQAGIAKGIIDSSIYQIKKANKTHAHINSYFDVRVGDLESRLSNILNTIGNLTKTPYDTDNPMYLQELLKARLEIGKIAIDTASIACLFSGTKGYMQGATPQRNLREAYFVAIVTPSIKHLYKELDDIQNGVGVMKKWKSVKNLGYYEI